MCMLCSKSSSIYAQGLTSIYRSDFRMHSIVATPLFINQYTNVYVFFTKPSIIVYNNCTKKGIERTV